MVYTNADGLSIRFGTDQATQNPVGSPHQAGPYKTIVATLNYANFNAFGTLTPIGAVPVAAIPSGAIIVKSELVVTTAFTSAGAPTLDIGLHKNDLTTAIDAQGIDATIALSAINAISKVVANDGALVNGVALTDDGYITVKVNTANYTAGKAQLSIWYFNPRP